MAYIPNSNSVVAFQSDPTKLVGTVSVVGMNLGNSSVITIPQGSITTLQGTTPWIVNQPSPSIIAYQLAGSVLAVSGSFSSGNTSVTAFQGGTWAVSVVGGPLQVASLLGTYQEKNLPTASAIGIPTLFKIDETNSVLSAVSPQSPFPIRGSVAALQGTNPWLIGNSSVQLVAGTVAIGSVATLQGTNPWIVNVPTPSYISITPAGSVQAVRTDDASVVAVLSRSSVAVLQGTNPWLIGNSSVQLVAGTVAIGSVATLQGTNPWIVNVPTPSYLSIQPGGSVLNANISGSVAAVFTTGNSSVQLISTSASIMVNMKSQFGANNTWTQNNSILATGGLRNDTMSSITTADSTYSPFTVGPIGETVVANSPITKWFSQNNSIMYGTSVQVVAAPGASIFTYITGIHVMNESANLSRVTITQGLGAVAASILTRVIAPATGGSNSNYINPIRVLDNNGISASISGVSSVLLTITGFTAKT